LKERSMPQARTTKTTRRKTVSSRAKASQGKRSGQRALDRLHAALEDAEKALSEVRKHVGSEGRSVIKDVDRRVRETRRDARKMSRSVIKELEQIGEALTPGKARRGGGRAGAAKKSTGSRKRSTRRGTGKASARARRS
jgi:hypothetical protein